MSNFKQQQDELRELEYAILQAGGEDPENQYEEMHNLVLGKATNVATLLDSKIFDQEIERLKNIKKDIDTEVKNIQAKKEWLEGQLHRFTEENGTLQIDSFGVTKYVSPKMSITRKVDQSKLNPSDKVYKVTTTHLSEVGVLELEALANQSDNLSINNMIIEITTGVTDLPKDHKAIVEKLRPTISITKSKKS